MKKNELADFGDFTMVKDRISHVLRAKNLTASQFADQLGIERSGISHLLSGRNKPSLDFIIKFKQTFPEYNLEWLIMGKGAMTGSESNISSKIEYNTSSKKNVDLFSSSNNIAPKTNTAEPDTDNQNTAFAVQQNFEEERIAFDNAPISNKAKLLKIIMIYSDNTFQELNPGNK